LKSLTVSTHLEELLNLGSDVDLLRFVSNQDIIPLIRARLEKLGPVGLAELKEGLPEYIGYDDIRLVRGVWVKNTIC
jgi:hypothetical protein